MSRILKVFATGAEADEVAALSPTAVRYDAFVVIETSDTQAKKLAADHLTDDDGRLRTDDPDARRRHARISERGDEVVQ